MSCGQNIVMTAFEKRVVQRLIDQKILRLYQRWVDDTFVRNDIADRDLILNEFHKFHEKIKFTAETAKPVKITNGKYKNETFYFIPSLDIGVYWSANKPVGFTKVYMKPTTSKIVMPYHDFGPEDWKMGTLIGFIRRAYTHCSDFSLMHEELSELTKRFRNVGYPSWKISQKINQTLDRILYKNNPTLYPDPFPNRADPDDLPTKWTVIYLPWAGREAGTILQKIRRVLPKDHTRISIAQTTNKLRELLPSFNTCTRQENDKLLASNVVYKYTCSCEKVYIGETMRRCLVRIREHGSQKSPMMEHIQNCPNAIFSANNFSIIAKRLRGREARKKYETLYIKFWDRRAGTINICEASRELTLF